MRNNYKKGKSISDAEGDRAEIDNQHGLKGILAENILVIIFTSLH